MKKKKKLFSQLFITTFIVMTVIIAVIMLLQYLFFDVLYENYKTNKMHSAINELAKEIEEDSLNFMELRSAQDEFMFTHNTYVSVVDEWGNSYANSLMSKQKWYTVTAATSDGYEIVFTISDYELYYSLQPEYDYDTNDELIALGDEFSILFDVIYNNKVKVHIIAEYIEFLGDETNVENKEDIVVLEVKEATQDEIDEYILYEYLYSQNYIEDAVIVEEFVDYSVANVINIEKEVYTKDGKKIIINAVVSLENVEDAAAALLSYYPYFLTLAVVCALIVSLIYSNKVSKPITNISKISNKMAMLHFEETVENKSNNEIGQLGENLNILADNLHNALAELKDANAQLIKDIEQKKEQEKARKEFVDNVSHELKTPLGIIRCYAESLKDDMTTKPKDEYYDDILYEVEKMTRMVMEMLELSKVESGDLKLNKTQLDIKGIIDDNAILHQLLADDKGMKIQVSGDYTHAFADAEKIDSAISNIIKNSVEYGDESSDVKITGETNDKICRISISNKCKGINQSEAEKFFERFYVKDKSRGDGSTGLGLSICAGIFKAHGFDYGINSDGEIITVWFEYTIPTF